MVYQRSITLGVLCGACVGAFAAPPQDHFTADVALESIFTDNALRVSTGEINERQDTFALDLSAQNSNSYSRYDLKYNFERTFFSERSQEDVNSLQGDAMLHLGAVSDWYGLTLQDSRRRVLNSSAAAPILANTSDRNIITVKPEVRARISKVDTLILGVSRETLRIKRANYSDSHRDGADLTWQHRLSEVDQFFLSLAAGESSRESSSDPDYEYQIARTGIQSQLNNLSYGAYLGYQQTQSIGQPEFGEPNYEIDLAYKKNNHIFTLIVDSSVSDTLFGDGNSIESSLQQDVLNQDYDLIRLTSASLGWSYTPSWRPLQLDIRGEYSDHDYLKLPEDFKERNVAVSLSYSFSPLLRASLGVGRGDTVFSSSLISADFNEDLISLKVNYDIVQNLSSEFLCEIVQRSSAVADDEYSESRVGLSLRYQF